MADLSVTAAISIGIWNHDVINYIHFYRPRVSLRYKCLWRAAVIQIYTRNRADIKKSTVILRLLRSTQQPRALVIHLTRIDRTTYRAQCSLVGIYARVMRSCEHQLLLNSYTEVKRGKRRISIYDRSRLRQIKVEHELTNRKKSQPPRLTDPIQFFNYKLQTCNVS